MNVVVYHNWKEIFLLMLRFRNRFSMVNCDVLRLCLVPKIEYLHLRIKISAATLLHNEEVLLNMGNGLHTGIPGTPKRGDISPYDIMRNRGGDYTIRK